MNKKQLLETLKDMDIDVNSISFYNSTDGEQPDTEFSYCDITGVEGNTVACTALSIETGEVIDFNALEQLVGGVLGRAAGAF